jgi:hypothetical protein
MSLPSQEHSSTDIQNLRAVRLGRLIDYVAEPYFFLTCKSCRVALPLSPVPAHSSSQKYHHYSHKDCVDALKAWQALFLSSRPIKLRNEDDLPNWFTQSRIQLQDAPSTSYPHGSGACARAAAFVLSASTATYPLPPS